MKISSYVFALIVASAISACAFETAPDPGGPTTEAAAASEPGGESMEPGVGLPCYPVLTQGPNGEIVVKEYLCPIPSPPPDDPATEAQPTIRPDPIAEGPAAFEFGSDPSAW